MIPVFNNIHLSRTDLLRTNKLVNLNARNMDFFFNQYAVQNLMSLAIAFKSNWKWIKNTEKLLYLKN